MQCGKLLLQSVKQTNYFKGTLFGGSYYGNYAIAASILTAFVFLFR